MGRKLTPSQKKAIREWYAMARRTIEYPTIDDMSASTYERIEMMHPTEIQWQNTRDYITDLGEKERE